MATSIQTAFPMFFDNEGSALNDGYVYIGNAGANPELEPKAVYWDAALTIPATQPLRTKNGRLVRNGVLSEAFTGAGGYSITVRNSARLIVNSSLTVGGGEIAYLAFSSRPSLVAWKAAGGVASAGDVASDGSVQYFYEAGATDFSDLPDLKPLLTSGRADFRHWGCVADGSTDDTTDAAEAIASGYDLTGAGLTIAVSGKISLPANIDIQDAAFKQLAPGASLSVRTLEASGVNNVTLRRVKVDRNGDRTNGGLLDATGVNGALHTAFGINIVGGTGHWLEDLEVYGDDSGTGIKLQSLDHTSTVIRPYAHDIDWARTTASDDMVHGIWIYRCTGLHVQKPRAARLAGVENGTPSRRYTRGIAVGGCVNVTMTEHSVVTVDQGVDVTGDEGSYDCVISGGYAEDCYTFGSKSANSCRRVDWVNCVSFECGVGFVASGAGSLPSDESTYQVRWESCHAINSGATGQAVVTTAGFWWEGSTVASAAADCEALNCYAVDIQGSATMKFGFRSSVPASVAPFVKNCVSEGHTTSDFRGDMKRPRVVTDSTSGYSIDDNGVQECWERIDISADDITTASGSLYTRATGYEWKYPLAFDSIQSAPVGSFERSTAIASGVHIDAFDETSADVFPWASVSIGTGNVKYLNLRAIGRAW